MKNQESAPSRIRSNSDMEQEVSFRLASLAVREFDLTPLETSANLGERVLRVKMQEALSPMARTIALSPEGHQTLSTIYALLHETNRSQMHRLIERIVGRSIWRSEIEVDAPSGCVTFLFELGAFVP